MNENIDSGAREIIKMHMAECDKRNISYGAAHTAILDAQKEQREEIHLFRAEIRADMKEFHARINGFINGCSSRNFSVVSIAFITLLGIVGFLFVKAYG